MLPSQRALFDIPRDICYLNAASWSPLPIATQEAGRIGVARKGKPWLIDPALPDKQFERARRAAARLIKADPGDVALISSVSYGVAAAAKLVSVPAGSRVLVLENDHSSAVLEWTTRAAVGRFTVEAVPRPGDDDWTAAVLAAIERPGAPPVGLASLSLVHWADGGVVDMDRIAAALRKQGAMLLVDATHATGVMKIDVRALDPDFLVFPTYNGCWGHTGGPFSTSRNAARTACRWSRPAMAGAPSIPSGRRITAIPNSSPMRGASIWASAIISFRWKWRRSEWR
jgi:selenocysteine lyase/cysteine desulfurase